MLRVVLLCYLVVDVLNGATITEQWEEEYSKVGRVMNKYALNTKFKALRGVMVVPETREVIWLTEKCSFTSSGVDDCDFYLQNVQTLMSIEQNPICRRAGGLSFSLDPWDTSDIWGNIYRKVYYPEACASILRTSIAGATMFDADWDLKQLVNNTMGIGSGIDGYRSVDELADLSNFYFDPAANQTRSSAATTLLTMTRMWVAVTGIQEATTPDHSVLYFGNVTIEVRASSVSKNISTPSGFSDSPTPPPLAYRKFVEHINSNMPQVLRRLKSFRQLAQLALAQEAVKFISARQGKFPDGYLQALDYTVDLPQQVPAVVSTSERTLSLEIVSQLLKANTTSPLDTQEEAMLELTAANIRPASDVGKEFEFPVQEMGDYSTYKYACSVGNGSLAHIESLQQLLDAKLLSLNCAQIVEAVPEEEEPKAEEFEPKKEEKTGIFNERPDLGDPCLPGALAAWDAAAGAFVMVPSAYLFIPGVPRMYNTTAEVVVARWTCTWPEPEGDADGGAGGAETGTTGTTSNDQARSEADTVSGRDSHRDRTAARCEDGEDGDTSPCDPEAPDEGTSGHQDRSDGRILHRHTHYAAFAPDSTSNSRRLQLTYNISLPEYTDLSSIDASAVSLTGKIVVVVMPRSWDTLPPACSLPQLLHELNSEWVHGADGFSSEQGITIDLDGSPVPDPTADADRLTARSRYSSTSVGTSRFEHTQELGGGRVALAGLVLVHSADFIIPVVEVDSGYLGDATVNAPVRVVSHNYGMEMVDELEAAASPVLASLSCGISRTAEVKEEDLKDSEPTEDAVFTVDFGKSTYRTLDSVNIKSKDIGCQAEYIQVPEGYEIVPALPDILTYVVGGYNWGTDKLVMADGNAYATALAPNTRLGKLMREIPLEWQAVRDNRPGVGNNQSLSTGTESIVEIRPGACASRILIRTKAVMVPYGGFFYHTMDLAAVSGGDAGCQDGAIVLPDFLDVAPAISDVINNIVAAYSWDTDVLVLQDRRGYFTGRVGKDLAGKMCCDRSELLYVADQPKDSTASAESPDSTSAGGNSSAPHWSDTEQVLSLLRCNARILVRQPIVTYIYNDTAPPSTLQFLDMKKTTQSVNLEITRISSGESTAASAKKSSGYQGKVLPGVVKSHIYTLALTLSHSLYTHGGVDLMNIKVQRMSEVPAEVLQELRDRMSAGSDAESDADTEDVPAAAAESAADSARGTPSGSSSPPDSTRAEAAARDRQPGNAQKEARKPASASDPLAGMTAAPSSALDEEFTSDFQDKRNEWGKRLGAAMDHLDDHILGNTAAADASADFIYRPASFSAVTPPKASFVESRVEGIPQSVGEVFQLMQDLILRVRVVRRRILATDALPTAGASAASEAQGPAAARAVSALLVETTDQHALWLVQFAEDGVVYASHVHSVQAAGASTTASIASAVKVAAKSSSAATEADLVLWSPSEDTWRLQQRWSDVHSPAAPDNAAGHSVVDLVRAMQLAADQRGAEYSDESNNCHMCQEDGRRFLGLSVEIAQFLQI